MLYERCRHLAEAAGGPFEGVPRSPEGVRTCRSRRRCADAVSNLPSCPTSRRLIPGPGLLPTGHRNRALRAVPAPRGSSGRAVRGRASQPGRGPYLSITETLRRRRELAKLPNEPSPDTGPRTATDNTKYTGQSCSSEVGVRCWQAESSILFVRHLTYQEGEGQPPGRTRQDGLRPAFTPPWFSLSRCQRRKTRPTRGDRDPAGAAPSAVPVLRRADDYRSRTAA